MEQVAAYITIFLKLLPSLIAAGEEILPIVEKAYKIWTGKAQVTQADFDELNALLDKNSAVIQAPIPQDEL
jgi:hypothetical protein